MSAHNTGRTRTMHAMVLTIFKMTIEIFILLPFNLTGC